MAYELELPSRLSDVHNVFHISQLKKCLRVPEEELPLEELERITRSKRIWMGKVQWSHHAEDEATWEREDELQAEFPQLFASSTESRGRDSF